MLRLLQSIFGNGDTKGGHSEEIVRNAVERAVDGTDPWLRSVTGYRKKLRPAVIRAMDYVLSLVDELPPPAPMSMESYRENPLVRAFFISPEEMREILGKDRSLADFLRNPQCGSSVVTALMFMEKKENRSFGVEMAGDRVMRDVPQVTVTFEAHRLMDPTGDEGQTRLRLKKRALDYLIRVALQRISAAKSERKDLERRNALLQAKLDVLRRGGWGFNEDRPSPGEDIAVLEESLRQIEAQLSALGSDDRMLSSYLDMVIDVLGRPEEHLRGGKETLVIDSMRIRREQPSSNAAELTLTTICDSAGRCRVAQMISLPAEELRDLQG